MMLQRVFWIFIWLVGGVHFVSAQEESKIIQTDFPSIPTLKKEAKARGYAGMMGGALEEMFIAAGGANFPNGLPWEGGKKEYYNTLYIFNEGQWEIAKDTLPLPLAYGASVQIPTGLLLIGGENNNYTSDQVFLLTKKTTSADIEISNYPALPEPLAYLTAVADEAYVYVAGGKNKEQSVNSFYRLDLSQKKEWEKLNDFPGPPRALHTSAIQETGDSKKLFLIGGRNQTQGKKSKPLSDVLAYDLKRTTWEEEGDLLIQGKPQVLMGASATALGSMHLLVFGGSDEVLFDRLENISLQLEQNLTDSVRFELLKERNELLNQHPGFSKNMYAYNTVTKKGFVYDSLQNKLPVTALSFKHDEVFYIVSGEVSPGIRTPKVYKFQLTQESNSFGTLNYSILFLYLLITLLIGTYFSRKQKSTEDYFVGGGRIPWWASGLSVFGTLLSAITFMAIPAKAFSTDWSFFFLNMTAILVTPIIAYVFIPYFNKLQIRTAYEFLEERFNYFARAFGSLSFILFQLGRIGIVLLLPALAISIVSGIPVTSSILLMGVLCVLYTAFGGIEAVIWTDVIQVVVLLGGSLVAVFWIVFQTEASFTEMIAYASKRNKFNLMNTEFNFTESTFWVVCIGGLASAMITQGTDQTIVQRYLTSKNVKDSQKTLYTNALLTLPASLIFFGMGTLLFIFYSELPHRLTPFISNNDSIFPWYIVQELPVGVSGLLVAGIFASAMSSISSSLNSVATAYCNDFHLRFSPTIEDSKLLKIARVTTLVTGILGVVLALWMANSNIKSLWDQFYRFLGLFSGGLGGMFLLGIVTKKANAKGTLIGLVSSAFLVWYLSVFTEISFLMFAFFGVTSCFVLGYFFSLIFKEKEKL